MRAPINADYELLDRVAIYCTVRFTVDVWLVAPDVAVMVIAEVPAGVVVLVYELQPASVTAPTAAPTRISITLEVILSFLRPAKNKKQAKGMKARAV